MIMQMRPRTVRAAREGVETGRERATEQREKERGGWIRVLFVRRGTRVAFRKFFADILLSLWIFLSLIIVTPIYFLVQFFSISRFLINIILHK